MQLVNGDSMGARVDKSHPASPELSQLHTPVVRDLEGTGV